MSKNVLHFLIMIKVDIGINPFTLRVPAESIVCYFHTFENNLELKRKVHKIFEGKLLFDFWLTFLLQIFSKKCFCWRNISKIVRPDLAALSVDGLNQ